MPKRSVYRKWDDEAGDMFYLRIWPNGDMLQIKLADTDSGRVFTIAKTTALENPLNPDAFRKYKFISSKIEFDTAFKSIVNLNK